MRDIKYTRIFSENFKSKFKINLNEGGARSSKSHSICQLLIYRFVNRDYYKLLITRKTLPSLRLTSYKLFTDLLTEYNYLKYCDWNKSERVITLDKKQVVFTSVDDPIKIRSTEFNDIWMEEANEFNYDDFMNLKTRLSAKADPDAFNQMFLSYNPTDALGYINQKVKHQADINLIQSTYKDNPFLSAEYIEILEALKDQDENYYKIYALGEYGMKDGIIYQPWKIINSYPESFDELIYGLDFGFNNPTSLISIGIKDQCYYLRELIYDTSLTNDDLIKRMNEIDVDKQCVIYADAAEPGRIEEISRAGYYIKPANKSVKDGIDFVQHSSKNIFTNPDNVNINSEMKMYIWKKDRQGNYIDEPVKFNDHAMDAIRYALYTHMNNSGCPRMRMI